MGTNILFGGGGQTIYHGVDASGNNVTYFGAPPVSGRRLKGGEEPHTVYHGVLTGTTGVASADASSSKTGKTEGNHAATTGNPTARVKFIAAHGDGVNAGKTRIAEQKNAVDANARSAERRYETPSEEHEIQLAPSGRAAKDLFDSRDNEGGTFPLVFRS